MSDDPFDDIDADPDDEDDPFADLSDDPPSADDESDPFEEGMADTPTDDTGPDFDTGDSGPPLEDNPFTEQDPSPDAPPSAPDEDDDPFADLASGTEEAIDDDVWEDLSTDPEEADPLSEQQGSRRFSEVSKHQFCEQCPHFTGPPDIACTHEGTDIVEFVDMETVRIADCPIVEKREELQNQ